MRSSELASLAGVTVRALRHYHQVGVLDEPARNTSGYREYEAPDLVRVLRIKRLASVGIALEQMPALLNDTACETEQLLDRLDTELAGEIQRLTQQRAVIAQLRASQAAPDLPPELAPFLTMMSAGASTELSRLDRDQTVLLAHLVGDQGMSEVARLYQQLSAPDTLSRVQRFNERFVCINEESSEQEISVFVDASLADLGPVLGDLLQQEWLTSFPTATDAFAEYSEGLLNDQQRKTIIAIQRGLREAGLVDG